LGEHAEELHEETGRRAAELGINRVVFVGKFGKAFCKGFVSAGGDVRSVVPAPDKDSAWDLIRSDLNGFDIILVKGSRAMRMEVMADRILEEN